jgi:hypothetical protein
LVRLLSSDECDLLNCRIGSLTPRRAKCWNIASVSLFPKDGQNGPERRTERLGPTLEIGRNEFHNGDEIVTRRYRTDQNERVKLIGIYYRQM